MRVSCHIVSFFALILINSLCLPAHGQIGFDLKVDKPAPYEERTLRAEKTDKPLKKPKRFFQNLTTHYNYFFNASTKLNEVIEQAKLGFKDDYTNLLPFYNYTLDATSQNTTQLDSVIYKSQTGIVMHDLRNDWIDNLYMLWGAAWYFEKKFDSAALMFQFINYSFAEKEKDGYYKYIGSRFDGNNALSIATKEDRKFPKNLVTPPSRNNAFIWQIRTFIELGNMAEAASLIATLKNDPLFPERLKEDLEEVQAYWFYRQNMWDSSATHLLLALDQATTRQERARWEFLAAQMKEKSGKLEEAKTLYAKSISHTTDPVMDVYARLNLVRIDKEGGENYIDKNISELLKMAKRDKYSDYRDVIYFMAAQMELERNNFEAAQQLLLKSAKHNNNNLNSKAKSYLLIADLSYDQKKYLQAAGFYDSLQTKDLPIADQPRVEDRKAMLAKVVSYSSTIRKEDSLQRIAAMPEEERTAYINKLVKQLRKQQGLDDNTPTSGSGMPANSAPTDLFASQSNRSEWYFYNNNLKTQGAAKFKQTWGNRPNVDNWRRFSDVNQQMMAKIPSNVREANKAAGTDPAEDNTPGFASLLARLPLTEQQLRLSNDSIRNALYELGMVYMNEMQDYPSAIETFENFRTRFPNDMGSHQLLFHLYHAYLKSGNNAKAEEIKALLLKQAPGSRFATILATGKDPLMESARPAQATKDYEAVYDMYIEGRFEEAQAAKRKADSMYRTNYWQPQLLYIEAVYHIRQRNDSIAKNSLQTLIAQSQGTPMEQKAKTLLDVLSRRKEIEKELTRLQIERPEEDSLSAPVVQAPRPVQQTTVQQTPAPQTQVRQDTAATAQRPMATRDSVIANQRNNTVAANPKPALPVDTTAKKSIVQPKPASIYTFDPAAVHYVMIILDKVDPLFVNEVKNAFFRYNRDAYYNQPLQASVSEFDADRKLVMIGNFNNAQEAIDYLQKAKSKAPGEILPWLKADKYSFSIMTDQNMPLFQQKKDLEGYRKFLDQNLPGKL